MRFHRLDLNHLVTLETLLSERSLTRAAERHSLTQPAISNALTKLRDYFGDELLMRHGRDMERTPFAELLLPSLRVALAQLQSVAMAKPGFDPQSVSRTVSVLSSDYVAQVFLPEVIRHFFVVAPNVSIKHMPINAEAISRFERGEIDAMICPSGIELSRSHPHRTLYTEQWVGVVRQGNAAVGDCLSCSDYYRMPHVSPSYRQYFLENHWQPPADAPVRPAVQLPFSAIPVLVSQTDYVAALPERLVRMVESHLKLRRVSLLPPPPKVQFGLYWREEYAMDAFFMWAIEQLVEVGTYLGKSSGRAATAVA
jgi:DNA-binding transcriptional LysR family regulator